METITLDVIDLARRECFCHELFDFLDLLVETEEDKDEECDLLYPGLDGIFLGFAFIGCALTISSNCSCRKSKTLVT